MPTGTYEHPLLGKITFKTKSDTWVRGDPITFTSGFDPSKEVKEVYVAQLLTVKGAHKGRFPFHVRGHAQLKAAFEEIEQRGLLRHIVEFGGFKPTTRTDLYPKRLGHSGLAIGHRVRDLPAQEVCQVRSAPG